jgi:23S rRNA (adenine2503-C2)-methyltransferase
MNLLGLTRHSLASVFEQMNVPKWRAGQVWDWVYCKGVTSFDDMSNVPANMRAELKTDYSIACPVVDRVLTSSDGTEKFLLRLSDDELIEMVLIPEGDRCTVCVSSQIGCGGKCSFCHTGTQQFVRNLEAHEIVAQVMIARQRLSDPGALNSKRLLTNIVMMGMGEPLHNYENVSNAIKIMMDQEGLAFSRRRITLSTSGVVPFIVRCGNELGVNLAVSLHASNDEIRNRIMPINNLYSVRELINACRQYPNTNEARRITFEYVMLQDVNDSERNAKEVVALIRDIPAKVNLIPWNPWPGAPFKSSPSSQIDRFAHVLAKAGVPVMTRTPRGQDIFAACGQLKGSSIAK